MSRTFSIIETMNNYIIVNATAIDCSGALSILQQFVENIPMDSRKWLLFVSPAVSISSTNPNVRIEPINGVKSMFKRLWWDAFGLKKWLKRHEIEPVASVSLQNTGFNVGKKVPSFIYYHQPLPFYPYRWNPLKKQERTFWVYKNIYPFFVKLFLRKNSKIFVQLEFIKDGFSKKFKHPKELINVYSPEVYLNCAKSTGNEFNDIKELIYPAMPYFYKNHIVIEDALKFSDEKFEIIFTIDSDSLENKDRRIKYIGTQSYQTICNLYQTCDALLFPSYIETYGLPLLEAALTGLPIVAADLPYAREVLSGYEGVTFVKYNDPQKWAKALECIKKGQRYKPIDISSRSGWSELFKSIK